MSLPYIKKELVRVIVAAQYHMANAEDEWETVDIRYSKDRGVYCAEHEAEDGGYILEANVDIDIDPEELAGAIFQRETEWKSLGLG